jgi:small GTP-binding protein
MTSKADMEIKISFIGQSSVGKTSLINQYIKHTFTDIYLSTIGADQVIKEIKLENGKTIKLNIWDTAGQERFRSVNAIFLKGTNIVIMVYDITKRESFEEMKNFWYKCVQDNIGDNALIGIAGNKSDLYENEQVSKEEGQKYADEINAIFKETTALSLESIDSLMTELTTKYYDMFGKKISDDNDSKVKVNLTNCNKKKNCCVKN